MRIYFAIGCVFLFAMALFWSVDSSIVYIFLGAACFFLFLGFNSRPVQNSNQSFRTSYRQAELENYPSTDSIADRLKNLFQGNGGQGQSHRQPEDAMAKGRKIALIVGVTFFILFTIPFFATIFGSNGAYDSLSYYEVAQQQFAAQEYDSAYLNFKRALELEPEYAEAMVGCGDILVIRNERDSAILMYDNALQINPAYKEATYKKALAWYGQKKYNEGIGILVPLIEAEPEYYDAKWLLGDCYYTLNKYDEAIGWYEDVYQNGGMRSSNLCYVMAYVYDTKQQYDKAISLYQETLTYDSTIVGIYKRLGELIPGDEGNIYRTKAFELKQ